MAEPIARDLGTITVITQVHVWSHARGRRPLVVTTGEEECAEVAEQILAEHLGLAGRTR